MKSVGEFKYASPEMKFGCGANVIIQTRRGIEFGEMVSLTCDGCDKSVSRDQIKSYVAASGSDYYHFSNGKILRLATPDDEAEWEHIRAETLTKKRFCQERADQHNLPMKVLECEHLFGGERTIFYFMSESRVDFRDLVRGLASEFRTRIEMRQVGARDEARLLADYETCGRECCCKTFLKSLKPVSMKMAKMQKATLDPAKVSGRCGRLKCCLRYEHTTYEELDKKLPNMGKRVQTPHGTGKVIGRQILTQLVLIVTDDGGRQTVPVEEIWEVGKPAPESVQVKLAEAAPPKRETSGGRSSDDRGGERKAGGRRPGGRQSSGRGKGRKPDSSSQTGSSSQSADSRKRPNQSKGQAMPEDSALGKVGPEIKIDAEKTAASDVNPQSPPDTSAGSDSNRPNAAGDESKSEQRGDKPSKRGRSRRGRRNRSRKRGPRSDRSKGGSSDGGQSGGNPPTGNGPSADK